MANLLLIVPPVVLNENDNERLRDEADDPACHVDHRDRVEVQFTDLGESLDLADALNHMNLLLTLVQQLLHSDIEVTLGHVIT